MLLICSSLDDALAVRGASQLRMTPTSWVCTPAERTFSTSLSASTLSKAPDTSEQYSVTRCPEDIVCSHESTKYRMTSLAPCPGRSVH
eukprot:15451689-Alexandrium_andersonii.AAC.1